MDFQKNLNFFLLNSFMENISEEERKDDALNSLTISDTSSFIESIHDHNRKSEILKIILRKEIELYQEGIN